MSDQQAEALQAPSTSSSENTSTKLAADDKTISTSSPDETVTQPSGENKPLAQTSKVTVESTERKLKPDNAEQKKKKPLYGVDSGPKMYAVTENLITPVFITKNLPDQFSSLPIYGQPKNKGDLPQFYKSKIREFVGSDVTDEEFEKLAEYCSPDHLRTGDEIQMSTSYPLTGLYPAAAQYDEKNIITKAAEMSNNMNLCIHKKLRLRMEKDVSNLYCKKFKYRGIRIMPFPSMEDPPVIQIGKSLEPGKELLFRVRIYRPFKTTQKQYRMKSTRHSVLLCDVIVLGRQTLAALRDRFVCPNDVGVRLDHSDNPDNLPDSNAKDLFPSGFLFINNVFYVDSRPGCADLSAPIREWAARRGLGTFPCKDLCTTRLDELQLRLGHPEVYVHQGNCEHPFTFSELRLLGPEDPLLPSLYPLHRNLAQWQAIYCTTCAEFAARWVVTGCTRVPFDPAYFCDTCFRLYLYKDGQKIGNFKAYAYKGNEQSVLKPQQR